MIDDSNLHQLRQLIDATDDELADLAARTPADSPLHVPTRPDQTAEMLRAELRRLQDYRRTLINLSERHEQERLRHFSAARS
jgi:hypothetical protein